MIILLEGPDGAGKTTLAKQLATRYDLSYHHEGLPPAGMPPLQHYGNLLEAARRGDCNVVFDRFALGERVYGPLFRGADNITPSGWRIFERLVRATGAIQVMCLPSYDTCYRAWRSGRREMFAGDDDLRKIYNAFSGLTGTQHRVFDYEEPLAFDELCTYLEQPRLVLPAGVVGSPGSRYLFVGERPNGAVPLPFFSASGSSRYLQRAIELAGFSELEIMLANAYRMLGSTEPSNLQLGQVVTVALGSVAAAACRAQGLHTFAVKHPQYWRRFQHHHIEDYATALRGAREILSEEYGVSQR